MKPIHYLIIGAGLFVAYEGYLYWQGSQATFISGGYGPDGYPGPGGGGGGSPPPSGTPPQSNITPAGNAVQGGGVRILPTAPNFAKKILSNQPISVASSSGALKNAASNANSALRKSLIPQVSLPSFRI